MHFECPICGAKYPFSPIGCRCGHKGPFALIDSDPPGPRQPLPQSFVIAAVFGIGVLVATQNWMTALVVGVAAALISSTRIGMFAIRVAFFAGLAWFALIFFGRA